MKDTPPYQKVSKRTASYLLDHIAALQERGRHHTRQRIDASPADYDSRVDALVLHELIGKLRHHRGAPPRDCQCGHSRNAHTSQWPKGHKCHVIGCGCEGYRSRAA